MARFLIVETKLEDVDDGPDGEPREEHEPLAVVPCEDTRAVCREILRIRAAGWRHGWTLFEMVGGRSRRRAVTFKMDGRTPYDVEVS